MTKLLAFLRAHCDYASERGQAVRQRPRSFFVSHSKPFGRRLILKKSVAKAGIAGNNAYVCCDGIRKN
jgi:hypothetical protein